jgi:hypothetical protein
MGNFSKDPDAQLAEALANNYVGVHIEQGVPLLDRDVNLLGDLLSARLQGLAARYLGDGIPEAVDGFRVTQTTPPSNDFFVVPASLGPGLALVGGREVRITTKLAYSAQPGVPALAPPDPPDNGSIERDDLVYLDVFERDADGTADAALLNPDDVGFQTSSRRQLAWNVRVAVGTSTPPPPLADHAHLPLAILRREPFRDIVDAVIIDRRRRLPSLAALDQRIRAVESVVEALAPVFGSPPWPAGTHIKAGPSALELTGRNFNVGAPYPRVFFEDMLRERLECGNVIVTPTGLTVTTPQLAHDTAYAVVVKTAIGEARTVSRLTVDVA